MFILIKSYCGQLLGDCEVLGAYETMDDAERAFTRELWHDAKACGANEDEVHNWLDHHGMPCGEHDRSEAQWRVFEVHSPKRNPSVAKTVSCECAGRIGPSIGDTTYEYEEL